MCFNWFSEIRLLVIKRKGDIGSLRKLCAGLLALLAGIWGWIPGVWAASAVPAASPSGAVVPAAAGDSIESWLWITAITVALAVGYAAWRRYEKNKRQK